jgi:hypothetical protein
VEQNGIEGGQGRLPESIRNSGFGCLLCALIGALIILACT